MNTDELRAEVGRLAQNGDEQMLRTFILEHFTDLPEDLQAKFLFAFYSEATEKRAGEVSARNLQTDALNTMEQLEKMKADLQAAQE